ncbi:hypothetical protein H0H92_004602 [Tricholoma furcatifolium]|nr:hypothetical protein H0H92_004602 [Tricholoma furcatifolium]
MDANLYQRSPSPAIDNHDVSSFQGIVDSTSDLGNLQASTDKKDMFQLDVDVVAQVGFLSSVTPSLESKTERVLMVEERCVDDYTTATGMRIAQQMANVDFSDHKALVSIDVHVVEVLRFLATPSLLGLEDIPTNERCITKGIFVVLKAFDGVSSMSRDSGGASLSGIAEVETPSSDLSTPVKRYVDEEVGKKDDSQAPESVVSTTITDPNITATHAPVDPQTPTILPADAQARDDVSQHDGEELEWLRASTGKSMTLHNARHLFAENSPNGLPWAASLRDIYKIRLTANGIDMWTMTGSTIARWMKENGETASLMGKASQLQERPGPQVVEVYPHRQILEREEEAIRKRGVNSGTPMLKSSPSSGDGDTGSVSSRVTWPWPLVPFRYDAGKLETCIPYKKLPKTIVVHDPWNVLEYLYRYRMDVEWTRSQEDRTFTYVLSQQVTKSSYNATQQVPIDNSSQESLLIDLAIDDASSCQIRVFYPPEPIPDPPQAHLYLSPAYFLGKGNHSSVYTAEWEIPRSMLDRYPSSSSHVLCRQCIVEEIQGISKSEQSEKMVVDLRKKIAAFKSKQKPGVPRKPIDAANACYPVTDDDEITFRTTVQWQDALAPTCLHLKGSCGSNYVPPTVRVRVAAKLSIEEDRHLVNEAFNYESFDGHLFQHWSGLSLVSGFQSPLPLGAVVPQYYGYYVPKDRYHGMAFITSSSLRIIH